MKTDNIRFDRLHPKIQYKVVDGQKIFTSSCYCLTSLHCSALPKIYFSLLFCISSSLFLSLYLLSCSLSLLSSYSSYSCPSSVSIYLSILQFPIQCCMNFIFKNRKKISASTQWKCLCKHYKGSSKKKSKKNSKRRFI